MKRNDSSSPHGLLAGAADGEDTAMTPTFEENLPPAPATDGCGTPEDSVTLRDTVTSLPQGCRVKRYRRLKHEKSYALKLGSAESDSICRLLNNLYDSDESGWSSDESDPSQCVTESESRPDHAAVRESKAASRERRAALREREVPVSPPRRTVSTAQPILARKQSPPLTRRHTDNKMSTRSAVRSSLSFFPAFSS